MFLFRDYKKSFIESMITVQEFDSKKRLIDYFKLSHSESVKEHDFSKITIKPYGYDSRVKWDTYIVHLENYGVLGFTNGPVK
jgi:hypothetical protein